MIGVVYVTHQTLPQLEVLQVIDWEDDQLLVVTPQKAVGMLFSGSLIPEKNTMSFYWTTSKDSLRKIETLICHSCKSYPKCRLPFPSQRTNVANVRIPFVKEVTIRTHHYYR